MRSRPGAMPSGMTPRISASKGCGSVPWTTVQPSPMSPLATEESGRTSAHGPGAASATPVQTSPAVTPAPTTAASVRRRFIPQPPLRRERDAAQHMPFPLRFLVSELGAQGTEPAQPLGVGDSGIRGRGRWEDEEARSRQTAFLEAVLWPLAEDALVGRLADEGDDLRLELPGETLEPLRGAGKVAATEIAAALRRPEGGVRQPVAEVEHLPLFLGS